MIESFMPYFFAHWGIEWNHIFLTVVDFAGKRGYDKKKKEGKIYDANRDLEAVGAGE